MEDTEILDTMKQLERVWERLGGPAPVPVPQEAMHGAAVQGPQEMLAALIGSAVLLTQGYRAAARRTRGQAARQLLARAAECSRDVRALQEQFFLLTGDSLRTRREPPEAAGLLRALRRLWSEEAAYRRGLLLLSAQTADGADRAQLGELVRRSDARSGFLRALLRRSMRED